MTTTSAQPVTAGAGSTPGTAGAGSTPGTAGARPAPGTGPTRPAPAQGPAPAGVTLVRAALCAGLAATAGASFHRVFPAGPLVPVVALAAAAPAVLSWLLTGWRRLPLAVVFGASVTAWLVVVSATLLRPVALGGVFPDAGVLRDTWQGLTRGWRQVLDTVLPASADPRLLVGVSALVWLASWLAVESALRGRSALRPALAPAAVFGAGLLAGVTGPGSNLAEAAVFVALAGLLTLARSAPAAAAGGAARRYAAGLAVVAAAAAVAATVGPRLPYAHARTPFNLRTLVTPPQQAQATVNPLDQVSAWTLNPHVDLFDVRMSQPEDLRLAVLDRFDGQQWSSGARYVPTGSNVPAPVGVATGATAVTVAQTVTIEGLSTIWLPAVNRPASVTGQTVQVDPVGGQVLDLSGTSRGMTYRVVSEVPQFSAAQLRAAAPADDAAAREALALPGHAPTVIARTAQLGTAGATFPYQQAVRLAAFLQAGEAYVPTAPPGHAYGHIAYFLARSHQGTSEQFATAFALMARTLGLPSRIVVGFQPDAIERDGTYRITGADVLVWPEIDFRGLGWVPFYPTPAAGRTLGSRLAGAGESSQRQRIDKSLAAVPLASPVAPARPAVPAPRARRAPGGSLSRLWPILAGLLAFTLAGYLLLALVLPARRRMRRRRAATDAAAVAGAWRETTARLRVLGLREVSTSTTSEIARFGADRLGGEAGSHLSRLAAAADGSEFASTPPGPSIAAEAWLHHDAVRRRVRAAVPVTARLRHGLRPATVLGRWRDRPVRSRLAGQVTTDRQH